MTFIEIRDGLLRVSHIPRSISLSFGCAERERGVDEVEEPPPRSLLHI